VLVYFIKPVRVPQSNASIAKHLVTAVLSLQLLCRAAATKQACRLGST
jgi:hypothetical protein